MRLLAGLAWDVVVLVFDALVPGRRTERQAWLEASAEYRADCQALRDAIERLDGIDPVRADRLEAGEEERAA